MNPNTKIWKEMKSLYQTRLNKIESRGEQGSPDWLTAKKYVELMEFLERSHHKFYGKENQRF